MGIYDSDGPGAQFRTQKNTYEVLTSSDARYYSGVQTSIWFGDIWVDDITAISWSYNQEKRPIYGYASQYFDAVAKGQVLVQGQMQINFREKGYLSYIVKNLPRIQKDIRKYQTEDEAKKTFKALRPFISKQLKQGTFNERTLQEIADLPKSESFWEIAATYENAIWGDLEDQDRERFDTPDIAQQDAMPNGFNILVTYGDIQAAEARSVNELLKSTSKSLVGVHLLGSSQVIESNGEPVRETYSFMARDMDKYMGTAF